MDESDLTRLQRAWENQHRQIVMLLLDEGAKMPGLEISGDFS